MASMSPFEKFLAAFALAAAVCSSYFLAQSSRPEARVVIRELPVGQIQMARGDTRWKGPTYGNHFRTWDKQKLFNGDALYAGAGSRLVLNLGLVEVTMLAQSRLAVAMQEGAELKIQYGEIEMGLPPGERVRVSNGTKFFEVSSVNGGRVKISTAGGLHAQNLDGDLIVRTGGKAEINVPKEEFFRARRDP